MLNGVKLCAMSMSGVQLGVMRTGVGSLPPGSDSVRSQESGSKDRRVPGIRQRVLLESLRHTGLVRIHFHNQSLKTRNDPEK